MKQVAYSVGTAAGRLRPFQVALVGRDSAGKDPTYEYQRERTEFTAVEYVNCGAMDLTVNGVSYRARAGDAYLLRRGTRFLVRNGTTRDWQRTWFVLDGKLVEPVLTAMGLDRVCVVRGGTACAAFTRLWQLAAGKRTAPETLAGVGFEILQRLSANLRADQIALSPAVLRAKEFLDGRGAGRINMAELAALMGCSPAHASRLFRKELGCTPHAYRREQQLAQAKLLVGHSTKSIKAIAYELGFCDQYHFARVFKAAIGVSPSAYRQSA